MSIDKFHIYGSSLFFRGNRRNSTVLPSLLLQEKDVRLTCVQPLAALSVGVPDEEVCALVSDHSQEVAVLVPAEAAAHPGQSDSIENLRVTVVNVDHLVVA